MRKAVISLLTLVCGALPGALAADHGLTIHEPWVREVPPVSENSAGYMRIANPADTDRTLVNARSEQFARVEFHESVEEEGTVRMEHQESLVVPAGGEIVLEPGGYHLMLIDRQVEALEAGDEVDIRLIFENGHAIEVTAPVSRHAPDGGDDGMGHHDHH